jgi:hypothetical protein
LAKESRIGLVLLAALASAPALAAEVYRTVAPDGTVSYSDRPVGVNPEAVHIAVAEPNSSAPPVASRPQRRAEPPESNETWPDVESRTPLQEAADRAAACSAAKEKLNRYLRARRIYRTTADGEREYLDDARIDAARERATAEVEKACQAD